MQNKGQLFKLIMYISRASLPVRTARLLQRSRTQTPSDAGISDGSASPAPAPASLLQDVVDIKTLLLQLKRVLQEVSHLLTLCLLCVDNNVLVFNSYRVNQGYR